MLLDFHICTIANCLSQYSEMKNSFVNAGFSEQDCTYTLFDNSLENAHDPYRTISTVLQTTDRKIVLFCHQDVRLDRGDGYPQLIQRLTELQNKEPAWAVAGNAGVAASGQRFSRITDPSGVVASPSLPKTVYSLDENFLAIRTAAHIRTSPTLWGFHLYATDLCFNAMLGEHTCHVIDFHLTHLSAGDPQSLAFTQSMSNFTDCWNPQLVCGIAETVTGFPLRLSRWRIIRNAMCLPRTQRRLRARNMVFIPYNASAFFKIRRNIKFLIYLILGILF